MALCSRCTCRTGWGNPNIKTKVLTDKRSPPTGDRVDTQAKTTYNNSYTYGSTRPHAPTKIGLQNVEAR